MLQLQWVAVHVMAVKFKAVSICVLVLFLRVRHPCECNFALPVLVMMARAVAWTNVSYDIRPGQKAGRTNRVLHVK